MRGGWEHENRDDARDPDSTQPVNCNRKISTMPPGGDGNNLTLNDIKKGADETPVLLMWVGFIEAVMCLTVALRIVVRK